MSSARLVDQAGVETGTVELPEAIFGIEPEEYELPSPISDRSQSRRPSAGTESLPPRPSTSQASESPHRQRLLESIMGGAHRSTPTPPPVLMNVAQLNQARSTPTPPPQRQLSYEPAYLAQQLGPPQVALRPAYESGFMAGYDAAQLPTPAAPRNNAGYDRPIFESGAPSAAPHDSPYGSKAGRRESAVFMGGSVSLNQQGSRSRLREESHY